MRVHPLLFLPNTTTTAAHGPARAQTDTTVYHLPIRQEQVSKAGKTVLGMTVNGGIPSPTIWFKEDGLNLLF